MVEELILSTMRLALPLIFAAYGGLLCERSGVANIALEAILLFSAFSSALFSLTFHSATIGLVGGLIGGLLFGLCFGLCVIYGKGDQIVVGTGFNLLAVGLIPNLTKSLYGVTGSTPTLQIAERFQTPLLFLILGAIATFGLIVFFKRTSWGLILHTAGEHPYTLTTIGISPKKVRLFSVMAGCTLASIGGVILSQYLGSGYIRNMAAGRGFIALAALILGGWRPLPTLMGCLIFAFADALQIRLQGTSLGGLEIPSQWIQILPYLLTLLSLAILGGRMKAPQAINKDVA